MLEPLLFSCLVSSTLKLEMIGDHRQLKPNVMQKFQFERINKVYLSIFERLISAPSTNAVPSTVVSIQYRMQVNICDLTRDFYKDIVDSKDHAICGSRKIGGSPGLASCQTQGREVPGVQSHLYFWTHTSEASHCNIQCIKLLRLSQGIF